MSLATDHWPAKVLRRSTQLNATAPVFNWRSHPERIVLEPRPGVAPSPRPPVRIFVGTEPAQYRIERIFVWSIEQVRDPARRYEIYLMRELAGFDQRRWLTGFTNYRFAIPYLAGGQGRAIYNDCDQIYLVDPALLFDLDMGPHGFMSINDHDTSVMLIDCARMIDIWSLAEARHGKRKQLEEKARAVPDLWGGIDVGWNSRDEEYDPATSKCVHFTTIHTQPWLPFPERYVYLRNPIAALFGELERSADAAGFQVFRADQPSEEYRALVAQLRSADAYQSNGTTALPFDASDSSGRLCDDIGPQDSQLEFSFGQLSLTALESTNGMRSTGDLAALAAHSGERPNFDVVTCAAGLELVPAQDVPWVIDEMFRRARRHLHVRVETAPGILFLPGGTSLPRRPRHARWWREQFELVAQRYPRVQWQLDTFGGGEHEHAEGGRRAELPRIWVLEDDKTGHTVQSVGLAQTLGWPHEIKHLRFNPLNRLSNQFLDQTRISLAPGVSAQLQPPWPDLVISTGRKAAPIARWIARQSGGRTRIVHLGRKGGEVADNFDLVVSCAHFRMPQHRHRVEISAPLNTLAPEKLEAARVRWQPLFADSPHPWIVLVVGGSSAIHKIDAPLAAKIAGEVREFAEQAGGRVFAITSPRTGEAATEAVARALGDRHHLHRWQPNEPDNPYFGFLALADAIVVTGESESMLSEACSVGAPVYIYPIEEGRAGARQRLREWVTQRAYSRPRKKAKGTVRPQQGLERLCAQLIARGWLRPPRDLSELHAALIRSGAARMFGQPLDLERHSGSRDFDQVAERVRAMFGDSR